jgi:RecB family exonuclease
MNLLLSSMAEVCERYRIEEKRLVVPGYLAGHVLCTELAHCGTGWINLHPETPTGLALRVAGSYLAEKDITLLSGHLPQFVVEEILQRLQERGKLCYFNNQKITRGLVGALTSALMELRECKVTSSSLSPDDFVSSKKGQDIKLILQEYEQYLVEHSCLDSSGLLAIALQLAGLSNIKDDVIYLVPSFIQWKPLEEELIRTLAKDNLFALPAEELNDTQFLNGETAVSYFHAYGITNEMREVLRQLHTKKIPLDQVTVAYTSEEYIPVMYSLSKSLEFGLSVFEGIPVFLTGPGRTMQGIFSWINSDFNSAVLNNLFLSGDVVIKPFGAKREIPASTAVSLLREAGIGWGRARYQLFEHFTQKAAAQGNEDAYLIASLIQFLIEQIPKEDNEGKVFFSDFCSGLASIVRSLCRIRDDLDEAALIAITSCLERTAQLSALEMGLEETIDRLTDLLENLRVGGSGPQPGGLHLTSYRNLIWSGRSYTYVVGLDANSFPGNLRQDPVLLDSERERIARTLPLGISRLKEKLLNMSAALASRRGELVLSYQSFDVVDNRELFPAPLLLQFYRRLNNAPYLDYSDFLNTLGDPVGYCSDDGTNPLDEMEWWLCKNRSGELSDRAVVGSCYTGINNGQKAIKARQQAEPTEYDGALHGKHLLSSKVFSCSQIEYLASCPFAYFLKYVLRVRPPEEIIFDPSRWLDPLTRGILLHTIFCDFMRQVKDQGELLDVVRQQNLIHRLAKELIDIYKRKMPPPSELVFQSEVDEILDCCTIFLVTEAHRDSVPLFFEVPFGLGAEEVAKAGCGLAEPISVDLGQGRSFLFRGKIDRIDQLEQGIYCVWDYKTGSARDYGEQLYFNQGRQIQHALYAIAAEEILKKVLPDTSPMVKYAGYLFPSIRGEGKQVVRPAGKQKMLVGLLNTLLEILENGTFVASHEGLKCRYCDYQLVCGKETAVLRAKEMFANTSAHQLDPWRRLQEYV